MADEPQDPLVAQSAFMLYGMIHARFIVTARGLEAMVGSLISVVLVGRDVWGRRFLVALVRYLS